VLVVADAATVEAEVATIAEMKLAEVTAG